MSENNDSGQNEFSTEMIKQVVISIFTVGAAMGGTRSVALKLFGIHIEPWFCLYVLYPLLLLAAIANLVALWKHKRIGVCIITGIIAIIGVIVSIYAIINP